VLPNHPSACNRFRGELVGGNEPLSSLSDEKEHIPPLHGLPLPSHREGDREEVRDNGTFSPGIKLHPVTRLLPHSWISADSANPRYPATYASFPSSRPGAVGTMATTSV
jgi:hypothetical protein